MTRILIMDDEDGFRTLLRLMLEESGYDVVEAADGEAGIQMYCKEPTDLIITDIFMPRKDGLEAITVLKRNYPDVKIIAISGGGMRDEFDYLNHAKAFGAQKIFLKPFDLQEMLDAIEVLLGRDK